jgi:hypothetical protein
MISIENLISDIDEGLKSKINKILIVSLGWFSLKKVFIRRRKNKLQSLITFDWSRRLKKIIKLRSNFHPVLIHDSSC